MGYAHPPQRGNGLHLRQFSRAYIVDDGNKRVVYVAFDGSMVSHAVKRDVCTHLLLRKINIDKQRHDSIGGKETSRALRKSLLDGQYTFERISHSWWTGWLYDVLLIRCDHIWICS